MAVVVGDCRQTKWVWEASVVGLAVAGEREHRLQQPLEPQGGPDLAQKPGPALAGVPERVCGARLHDDGLACRGDQPPATEAEPHRAVDDPERLGLVRMDVHAGDRATRFQHDLGDHDLAVGIRRRLLKRHRLPGDGVCDRVSRSNHSPLPPVVFLVGSGDAHASVFGNMRNPIRGLAR